MTGIIAILFGVTGALLGRLLWRPLSAKYERDVKWLDETYHRLKPNPPDARMHVKRAYLVLGVLVLGTGLLLRNPVVPLALVLAAQFLPKIVAQGAWEKHRKLVNDQLPEAIHGIAGSVSAGMTLAQAVDRAAVRSPEPIRSEWRIMAGYWRMGADFETTLDEARGRLQLPDFNLLSSALLVNHRMGGDVTRTLEELAGALESISTMRREMRSATADGRMNIKVLTVAPFIMLGMTAFMQPRGVVLLFTTGLGQSIVVACVMMAGLGIMWASKIINANV